MQSEGGPAAQPRNEVMLGMRWFEMAAIDCSSELVSISTVSVSAASIRVSTDSVLFVSRIFREFVMLANTNTCIDDKEQQNKA